MWAPGVAGCVNLGKQSSLSARVSAAKNERDSSARPLGLSCVSAAHGTVPGTWVPAAPCAGSCTRWLQLDLGAAYKSVCMIPRFKNKYEMGVK